jgi:hypothetical protein
LNPPIKIFNLKNKDGEFPVFQVRLSKGGLKWGKNGGEDFFGFFLFLSGVPMYL